MVKMTDIEYHEFLEVLATTLGVTSLTNNVDEWLETNWSAWHNDMIHSVKYNVPRNYSNCDEIVKSSLLDYLICESETSDNILIY